MDGVERVLCLDLVKERADELADKVGAESGVFPDDLPGDIDGVSVTTPPHCHYPVVKQLLDLRVPTFCEKPLTVDAARGAELVELAEGTGTPLLVGFKMRFEPVFRRAREVLPRLGQLYGVSVTKCQPHHARPVGDWVLDVGALFELSSHDLDLVNWLTSRRPHKVWADLDRNEGWTGDTRFYLNLEYDGGFRGQFMGGYCEEASFCYRDLTMTFLGRRGYIRVERPNRIVCHLDEFDVIDLRDVDTNTFPLELRNFLDVIRGAADPFITAREGHLVTQVIQAARRSSDQGAPCEIPPPV